MGRIHPHIWQHFLTYVNKTLLLMPVQAGRRTLVLEKTLSQPDRIVGELLQPGGYLMLKKMGLEECTREIDAQEVYGYALFKGTEACNIHYPTEGYDKDVSGRSFHHGRCERDLDRRCMNENAV